MAKKQVKKSKSKASKLETKYYESLLKNIEKTSKKQAPKKVRSSRSSGAKIRAKIEARKLPVKIKTRKAKVSKTSIDYYSNLADQVTKSIAKKPSIKNISKANKAKAIIDSAKNQKIKVKTNYELKKGRLKSDIQKDIVKKFITKIDKKAKYNAKTKTFSLGKSIFSKLEMARYQDEIRQATREYEKMVQEANNFAKMEGEQMLEQTFTDKQLNVLFDIVNSGMDLEEFKSKYPDDYERLFGSEDPWEI